jgi:uncharacterized protein YjbJ (UPF0337 family)
MGTVDKANNAAQTAKGTAKEVAGRLKDDRAKEAEGTVDRMAGNLKQAGEKVKDAVRR